MKYSLTFSFPAQILIRALGKGYPQEISPHPSLPKRGIYAAPFKGGKQKKYYIADILTNPTLAKGGMGGFVVIP
jgi:hypothetical protein